MERNCNICVVNNNKITAKMLDWCNMWMWSFYHKLCGLKRSYLCLYPMQMKFGGYIGFTLSVCLSVHLSLCPLSVDMILSTHVLRDGCIDFSENVYTNYSLSEDVHLEFSYWLDKFSSFYRLFFLFLDLVFFLIKRNSVLKIMRNFDLSIENVLFLNWNFVFTIMINNIV